MISNHHHWSSSWPPLIGGARPARLAISASAEEEFTRRRAKETSQNKLAAHASRCLYFSMLMGARRRAGQAADMPRRELLAVARAAISHAHFREMPGSDFMPPVVELWR